MSRKNTPQTRKFKGCTVKVKAAMKRGEVKSFKDIGRIMGDCLGKKRKK